jgi:hypothetical protein
MPWTTADVDKHHKGLSDSQKRQWVHVANGCMAKGGDDGSCIRMANGVVNKSKEFGDVVRSIVGDKYQYVESYDYADRALSQEAAGYNSLGATDTQGCANCQWFVAPSRCSVVAGEISPTGLSSLWRAKEVYTAPPIPVVIVEPTDANKSADGIDASDTSSGSLLARVTSAVSTAVSGWIAPAAAPPGPREKGAPAENAPLVLVKQKDGRYRFFSVWTNNFYDREDEVFPEFAHKEFVEYCNDAKSYPELWLWHTPGTKYGQVDWVDMTDGFVCASGLIDAGKEALAEQLVREDTGLSHGFYGLQRGKEIIWYRAYEISTLPRSNAAVWTTSFNLLNEGTKEMGFTPQRKQFLLDHGATAEQIASFEQNAQNLSTTLKNMGVGFKDTTLEPEPAPAPVAAATTEPVAVAAVAPAPVVDEKQVQFQTEVINGLETLRQGMAGLAGIVQSMDARVKSVERSEDDKIAAALAARSQPGTNGVAASKDESNVVGTAQTVKDAEFWGDTFFKPFGITLPTTPAPATANQS